MSDINIFSLFIVVFTLLLLIGKLQFIKKLLKVTIILILYFIAADVFPNLRIPYFYEFLHYIFFQLTNLIEKLLGGSNKWL